MDFVKDTVENKMNKDAQPGNSVESTADGAANQGMWKQSLTVFFLATIKLDTNYAAEVDKLAGDAGVPQSADSTINEAVDDKINSDIPGGNN